MTDATADLNTVSWGDPDAPNTALLVHGLTGRADAFRTLAENLESGGSRAGSFWRWICEGAEPRGGWK
jgi:alpha-beta hydrolase superfamily lysophospholipase